VALRLGGALWSFWSMRGYQSAGRRWLEEGLAMDGRGSPEVRAMALAGVGALALDQGDYDRAKEACQEGLELLANEAREEASEAKLNLLEWLGLVAMEREEHGQATQLFEEILALSRAMSDTWWLATSLSNLSQVSHSRGTMRRYRALRRGRRGVQGARSHRRRDSGSLQPGVDSLAPRRSRQGC
jgi:tetratricopeptide (TPR) repeat protein